MSDYDEPPYAASADITRARELAKAVALGDIAEASIIIDLMVRDEELDGNEVALGRTDAANIRRRTAPELAKAA